LLTLTWTWQNADIAVATHEAGGKQAYRSTEEALKGITCKALVMPTRTDQYFTPEHSEKEIKHMPNVIYKVVETIYGHVGGGGSGTKDDHRVISKAITEAMQ